MNSSIYKYQQIQSMTNNLRVKDVRLLFMLMRQYPQVTSNSFFPQYGLTTGEFCTAYVLNMPHRTNKR